MSLKEEAKILLARAEALASKLPDDLYTPFWDNIVNGIEELIEKLKEGE